MSWNSRFARARRVAAWALLAVAAGCTNDLTNWQELVDAPYANHFELDPESHPWEVTPWAGVCGDYGILVDPYSSGRDQSTRSAFMRQGEPAPVGYASEHWNSRRVTIWGEGDPKCVVGYSNMNRLNVDCWMTPARSEGTCDDEFGLRSIPLRFDGERRWENAIWECP